MSTVAKVEPMRGKVLALEAVMREMPQVQLHTEHYFADGMYCRLVARKAGVTIVGKVHKKEHLYIVAKGRVKVVMDNKVEVLEAGDVRVSKPGTKRAVVALKDAICMTVHRTDSTDLAEIEKELIEEDHQALFDSSNKLKALK